MWGEKTHNWVGALKTAAIPSDILLKSTHPHYLTVFHAEVTLTCTYKRGIPFDYK